MKNKNVIHVWQNTLDLSDGAVMAIINITPDSFWAGSRRTTSEDIRIYVETALHDGAAILDCGGYSSRPGAEDVSAQQEFDRLSLAIDVIRKEFPSAIISLDTFRSDVAGKIIEIYGPCIINDISAGELDHNMIPTAASLGVPYIAMHMRSTPATMQHFTQYGDIIKEVEEFFDKKIAQLEDAGIEEIIIDPGFGFAKTTEQNYRLMAGLHRLCKWGYPLLAGVSRKSMIYKVLENSPQDALAGTCALNWESIRQGASILRVHDTKEASEIIKLHNFYKRSYAEQ